MIRYTFVHKKDPKKIPAKDHWGRPIIYNTRKKCEELIKLSYESGLHGIPPEAKDLLIIESKSKIKNVGSLQDLSWSYWDHFEDESNKKVN